MRSSASGLVDDAEARARKASADAHAKYDAYKSSAEKSLFEARSSTEHLYDEARAKAEAKTEEVKDGWFSWLGWGKSKVDQGKKEGAQKVADAAGSVKKEAEKHT